MLAEDENFAGLARINWELIGKAEAVDSPERVVLDMDSTDIPVHGQQERSAYNGHFESTCYDPLLLFNREGGLSGGQVAARQRPQRRRDSGRQGRGNQSWAVKIRAFGVREDQEVSLEVAFGPFFGAGAPDPGPCQRGRCAKNDKGCGA
jgi:hypothetical protein